MLQEVSGDRAKGFQMIHRRLFRRSHESNQHPDATPGERTEKESCGQRLHLGCGEVYLPGYLNIDLPPQHQTVMRKIKVDIYADISRFYCATNSIEEIGLHHVFEHFDRPTALQVLISWYLMLKDMGRLVIETPDFEKCVPRMFAKEGSLREQMVAARHIFRSHEAPWAIHRECWYRAEFKQYLGALGFSDLSFDYSEWHGTFNISVIALKRPHSKLGVN